MSIVALLASFSFCFWQNDAILEIVTKPVTKTQNLQDPSRDSQGSARAGGARSARAAARRSRRSRRRWRRPRGRSTRCATPTTSPAAQRRQLDRATTALATAARESAQAADVADRRQRAQARDARRRRAVHGDDHDRVLRGAAARDAVPALPGVRVHPAGVQPAASARSPLPLMLMVPVLFICGVLFGYFVVLERAVAFLQNFNDDSFDILLAGQGLLQVRGLLPRRDRAAVPDPGRRARGHAARDLHARSSSRTNRGYVILGIAVLAAVATPTPDPVTMTLAMAPLIVLFELSILLARWLDRIKPPPERRARGRRARRRRRRR